jgi:hypothetical protein
MTKIFNFTWKGSWVMFREFRVNKRAQTSATCFEKHEHLLNVTVKVTVDFWVKCYCSSKWRGQNFRGERDLAEFVQMFAYLLYLRFIFT